jgi:hypothetical protein
VTFTGERALAWRGDLQRVAESFPELLEACWQYGVRLVAWRNQFNDHARDVGAVGAPPFPASKAEPGRQALLDLEVAAG